MKSSLDGHISTELIGNTSIIFDGLYMLNQLLGVVDAFSVSLSVVVWLSLGDSMDESCRWWLY